MAYTAPLGNVINFDLVDSYLIPDGDVINFDLREVIKQTFIDISLNIGINVLDICYSDYYVLVCTNSGVECLNGRTFESIWCFDSTIIRSTCYNCNQDIVCFGTTCSGVYYNYFPTTTGILGSNFLGSCKQVNNLISNKITSMCTTSSGFFVGEDGGVNVLVTSNSGLNLEVTCQLTCSGVNSVAYSYDTETYYWSTASKVYCANTCT